MTPTEKLIKEVKNLLSQIAGTQAGESQAVIEIWDAIGKIELQDKVNEITTEWINGFKPNVK